VLDLLYLLHRCAETIQPCCMNATTVSRPPARPPTKDLCTKPAMV
jgi:hypothetical protein